MSVPDRLYPKGMGKVDYRAKTLSWQEKHRHPPTVAHKVWVSWPLSPPFRAEEQKRKMHGATLPCFHPAGGPSLPGASPGCGLFSFEKVPFLPWRPRVLRSLKSVGAGIAFLSTKMGREHSRQLPLRPAGSDASAPEVPPRAPRWTALDSWFRKVRTRRSLRRVSPENVAVPVDPPSPPETQGTRAEAPSPRTLIIEVRPASKFLGREKLPWEASSLQAERKNQTSESAESSFLSEQILTSPKDKQPIELGSKEVGIPSEVLEEGAARALDTESVHEPPLKTSTDSEAATLADIPSLEDEVWDPLPSTSSSVGPGEDEDPALHPRRWSSLDPEQAKQHLHHLCLLVCSSSSAEVTQAVDYVARKHLKMATDHFLESGERACGELVSAVLNSPYCCLEAALDLFLAKVKEGPWLAQEGEEQGSPTFDAVTARATRAIGGIVRHIRDSTRLEGWFLELLLALVTNFIEVTRPGLEAPSRNRSNSYVPPEELANIIIVLVKRVAPKSFNRTSEWMLEDDPSICPEGIALQLRSLLKSSSSLVQHLHSIWEKEAPLEHSAGMVAFYVQLLKIGQRPHSSEKTWALLTAWLQHHSLAVQHQSRQGLLLLCETYWETMGLQELLDGIIGGMQSPHTNIAMEFLNLAGQLEPLLHIEDRALAKVHLTATCRRLFHHEAANIRTAALECFRHFIWRPGHPLQERQTISDLLVVLMHVEDEDEEVAKTARETLREAADVLNWHLKDSVLAEDTFSLQELLHKISKRLIHHCRPRKELEEQVYGCLRIFKSQRPSARKVAAMLVGHILHKNYKMCADRNLYTYHAWLINLLEDRDPEVRRVGRETKTILARVTALHHRHGLRAALRRLAAPCRRERYPPEYAKRPPA
ncbi:uncharacterized protein LOC134293434 isoform X1 [Anolis carolinensis]|uniref:uncharacterized protein LOC134293434 isoform X1 n=1 Tax=Anolis carolinensis TaxID=28377 RepID=UPI002F2B8AED